MVKDQIPRTLLVPPLKAIEKVPLGRIDQTLATALKAGELGIGALLLATDEAGKLGSFALDQLNPDREDQRKIHEGVKEREGRTAVIGALAHGNSSKTDQEIAEITVDELAYNGVFAEGSFVVINSVVADETPEELKRHSRTAKTFQAALTRKFNVTVATPREGDPVRIPLKSANRDRAAFMRSIMGAYFEAAIEMADNWTRRGNQLRETPAPALTNLFVINPKKVGPVNGINNSLQLFNGRAAVLDSAGKNLKDSRWKLPLEVPDEVRSQLAAGQIDHRQGRFSRDNQLAIEPANGAERRHYQQSAN